MIRRPLAALAVLLATLSFAPPMAAQAASSFEGKVGGAFRDRMSGVASFTLRSTTSGPEFYVCLRDERPGASARNRVTLAWDVGTRPAVGEYDLEGDSEVTAFYWRDIVSGRAAGNKAMVSANRGRVTIRIATPDSLVGSASFTGEGISTMGRGGTIEANLEVEFVARPNHDTCGSAEAAAAGDANPQGGAERAVQVTGVTYTGGRGTVILGSGGRSPILIGSGGRSAIYVGSGARQGGGTFGSGN